MSSPLCEITSSGSPDDDQKMIDCGTVDQKMSPPLQESDPSSHNATAPLTPPASNPASTPPQISPLDNKGNIPPTTTEISNIPPTNIPNTQVAVLNEALQRLFGPSTAQQAQLDIARKQAQYKALGRTRNVKPGHEFDYGVNRRRDLRLEKLHAHKNSMPPALQQALAAVALKRVKREAMEKKKSQEEKRKAWELDLELFSDGGNIFGDDDDLF